MLYPPHLGHLAIPEGAFASREGAEDADQTGLYGWPAGQRLSAALADLSTCTARQVLDLGCGRGHLGLTALQLGAQRTVFADGNQEVLDGVAAVIAANRLTDRAEIRLHQWGTQVPGAPFDLILGGDVLYRPASFSDLMDSLADSLAKDGEALLSDPRHRLEGDLPTLASERGLGWNEERRDTFTLIRICHV